MKRLLASILLLPMLVLPVRAESIKWVEFNVSCESMKYALEQDIATFDQEKHISWIDILALAACRTGGKCGLASVKQAVSDLKKDESPEQLLGDLYKYYDYYHRAYTAALGGLVGSYAIEKDGQWVATYGLKAFSPIAAGYGYSHCDDFGVARSFGFRRKHLGNDLMGALGTPVVAVEGGVVEAMGWNRYGGWRVGIRSFDSRRYYYYAHLQKDTPFAPGLAEGDTVQGQNRLFRQGKCQQYRDGASALRYGTGVRREPEGMQFGNLDQCLRYRPAAVRPQEQHSADGKRLGQGIPLPGSGLGRIPQGAAIKNGMQKILHPANSDVIPPSDGFPPAPSEGPPRGWGRR